MHSFEITTDTVAVDDERSRHMDMDRQLNEAQQSWLLRPQPKKMKKYVDFGCIVCSYKALLWTIVAILFAFLLIGLPIIVSKSLPNKKDHPTPPDDSSKALHTALRFFNAQKFGGAQNLTQNSEDKKYWQRPEDMPYEHLVQITTQGPDLAGEMALALAAASIVFHDDIEYSKKLLDGVTALYNFANDKSKCRSYSRDNSNIARYYNSTGYWDEIIWSAAWMFYVSGNVSYLERATEDTVATHAKAFSRIPDLSVLSWDNKLLAAELLLIRLRIFLGRGYPYEGLLRIYHNEAGRGLILLNHGRPQSLQYVANTAFLAFLFADYMNATGVPGCDSLCLQHSSMPTHVNYILGANPMNMSYLVGYGDKFPNCSSFGASSMAASRVQQQGLVTFLCFSVELLEICGLMSGVKYWRLVVGDGMSCSSSVAGNNGSAI
ncbi:hypothetical protein IFM89_023496 [Coptis chinensis]|uniref:cellulase n=1 Tax=Coptis chinensis TaxID=261450 RepID=A0A835I5Z5_9MAGN|nr:hypothetical protein IFM89_023496 [Coptis chinensis]